MIEPVQCDLWGAGIAHGFCTRQGGVSQGLYASLNVGFGSDDEPTHVARNRTLCQQWLGAEALVSNYQVHGAAVVHAIAPEQDRQHQADALITDRPGLALGILTADCVPVLFADEEAKVIGAAHAGWRGAAAGVLHATVEAMAALGACPQRVGAAVGPAIQQSSYEVGADVFDAFTTDDPDLKIYFRSNPEPGKYQFDLPGAVRHLLERMLEPTRIQTLSLDTYQDEERFFSCRRAAHRGEPDYGRQLSAIMLRP